MDPFLRLKFALTLGLMISLTACQSKTLTEQEQHTVTELTSKMQTHCVGRYLIDLPTDTIQFGSATMQDVRIETQLMSQQEFLDGMHKREKKLMAIRHMDGYQFMYGDREYSLWDTSTEKLRKEGIWHFIHLKDKGSADSSRFIEAYKWNHGYRVKLEIEGFDYRRASLLSALSMSQLTEAEKNDVPGKLSQVLQFASAFRGRAEDEIPKEPGVCFLGGFLLGKAIEGEVVVARFVLSNRQDVNFAIRTDDKRREKTLLQRHEQINSGLSKMDGGKTVRKGSVALSGLKAEEWLIAAPMDLGVHGQNYFFF